MDLYIPQDLPEIQEGEPYYPEDIRHIPAGSANEFPRCPESTACRDEVVQEKDFAALGHIVGVDFDFGLRILQIIGLGKLSAGEFALFPNEKEWDAHTDRKRSRKEESPGFYGGYRVNLLIFVDFYHGIYTKPKSFTLNQNTGDIVKEYPRLGKIENFPDIRVEIEFTTH
jgi:hypothetical protein